MSAVLTSPLPGVAISTRPKIHRLPAAAPRKLEPILPKKLFTALPYIVGGAVVLGLLAAIPPQHREQDLHVSKAATVPKISVTPEADTASAEKPAEAKMAMVDAKSAPVQAVQPAAKDETNGKTIVLQDKNDKIIGQMARIPAESEPITEIKSASEVDNNAGRELLSIINKY